MSVSNEIMNTVVTASTVVAGVSLAAYHSKSAESISAAAALLAILSAVQLTSPDNTKIMKGVAASVWGYLSHKMFSS